MYRPVSSRTRGKEALMLRELYEQRKKQDNGNFSSSGISRDLKTSSNAHCDHVVKILKEKHPSESMSFSGVKKVEGKGKGKTERSDGSGSSQNDNVSKDFGFGFADDNSVKDSNFYMGSSNCESGCGGDFVNKVCSEKSLDESFTSTKNGNLGRFDTEFIAEDGVIEIPDGIVECSSDEESAIDIPDDDDDAFQISSSEESKNDEDDEDYSEDHFEIEEQFETSDGQESAKETSSEGREVHCKRNGERRERGNVESPLGRGNVESPSRTKRRYEGKSRNNKIDIAEILGNSMFNEEEEEELEVISEPETPELPQKFTFGIEEPIPVEKTEEEKELDELWAEMDLALCGEDTTYNSQVRNEPEHSGKVESTIADDCSQGKHELILDEEIGLICRFCRSVQQEIRDYCVPFNKNPFGRSVRRDSYHERVDAFGKLHLHDLGDDTLCGDDFNSNVRGTVWNIIPGIGKDLHPHQREGFEFLWKNIGGGIELDKLKEPADSDEGSGCIISHAPGTGKTRLAIVFLQSYMKLHPSCKPVIIAPCGMLLYWESEFKKWNVNIPFHNLNLQKLSGKENEAALKLTRGKSLNRLSIRMVKLYSWKKERSVLALSYQLFNELVGEDRKRKNVRLKIEDVNVQKVLLEIPSLLVLDEGHTARNEQSQIWKALSRIRTEKRIILSGTPFQNNFDELFNTLCLARPKFSSEFSESVADKRLKHSAKKRWNSLTGPIGEEDTNEGQKAKRLEEVRNKISPFVHVHEGNILQQKLPGLRDAVIILQPDQFQKGLLDRVRENKHSFELEHFISVVSLHPSLMPQNLVDTENSAEFDKLESLRLDADAGVKTKFLMELIRISDRLNEQVLVFSQYIDPLGLICEQLIQQFKWTEGREILHMDGSTNAVDRQSRIKSFNTAKSEAKVMLAATKACSEGISLVGASRVVLLDVLWNPQVERQAISRAYRLGQTKVVHIYHLITSGTMEEEKYRTQAKKERLSDLVLYSRERTHSPEKLSSNISDDKKDKILEHMVEGNKLKDILKKIIYEPKANFSDGLLNL